MSSYSILSEESGGSVVRHRRWWTAEETIFIVLSSISPGVITYQIRSDNMFNFDRINHKQINILWLSCQLVGTLANNLGWGSRRMADMPCSSSSQ